MFLASVHCTRGTPIQSVGLLTRRFDSESTGAWTLDYVLGDKLAGDVTRTEIIVKLSDTLPCAE